MNKILIVVSILSSLLVFPLVSKGEGQVVEAGIEFTTGYSSETTDSSTETSTSSSETMPPILNPPTGGGGSKTRILPQTGDKKETFLLVLGVMLITLVIGSQRLVTYTQKKNKKTT